MNKVRHSELVRISGVSYEMAYEQALKAKEALEPYYDVVSWLQGEDEILDGEPEQIKKVLDLITLNLAYFSSMVERYES